MSFTPALAQTLRQALATVVVVPVTPLDADGNPDWNAYAALTRRVIDGGITVITPNGNTGEFYALSQAEARQVIETAAAASHGQAEPLAGVGHDVATAVGAAARTDSPRAWPTSPPPCRWPCSTRCAATTSAPR